TRGVNIEAFTRGARLQSGEVVLENECRRVRRISNSSRSSVAGTQVAIRIVGGLFRRLQLGYFALPGTRGAVRRNQHPFVGQGIQSAMWIFREFQMAASQHFTTSGGPSVERPSG